MGERVIDNSNEGKKDAAKVKDLRGSEMRCVNIAHQSGQVNCSRLRTF